MASDEDRREDGYGRASDPEEPGSHSGAESQAQDRSIPGTASNKEGYQPERGTTAGTPLEGIETEEGAAPDAGDDEESPAAS
ncbi:hypothetical protein [Streptomyces coeruleorubidus]|uniref:hypothetical protein n=1 Tax=Streptomyces coeruleorubidus TaxID=116188 RepID=UPI00049F112D|nr:hypothetical protein DF19_38325 [Streptomyces olindensis]